MKLIIDISKETYNGIKIGMRNRDDMREVGEAIENGTPLLKEHGRIGDLDALREEVSSWGMNDYEPSDFIDAIDDAPTVEAIPKADFEARLKADLEAILVEIQLEIEESPCKHPERLGDYSDGVQKGIDIIQQKINALKENSCGNNKRKD